MLYSTLNKMKKIKKNHCCEAYNKFRKVVGKDICNATAKLSASQKKSLVVEILFFYVIQNTMLY